MANLPRFPPFEKNGHVRGQCHGGPLRALGAGGGEEFGAAGTLANWPCGFPWGFPLVFVDGNYSNVGIPFGIVIPLVIPLE